jgi:hypothetical protein
MACFWSLIVNLPDLQQPRQASGSLNSNIMQSANNMLQILSLSDDLISLIMKSCQAHGGIICHSRCPRLASCLIWLQSVLGHVWANEEQYNDWLSALPRTPLADASSILKSLEDTKVKGIFQQPSVASTKPYLGPPDHQNQAQVLKFAWTAKEACRAKS